MVWLAFDMVLGAVIFAGILVVMAIGFRWQIASDREEEARIGSGPARLSARDLEVHAAVSRLQAAGADGIAPAPTRDLVSTGA